MVAADHHRKVFFAHNGRPTVPDQPRAGDTLDGDAVMASAVELSHELLRSAAHGDLPPSVNELMVESAHHLALLHAALELIEAGKTRKVGHLPYGSTFPEYVLVERPDGSVRRYFPHGD